MGGLSYLAYSSRGSGLSAEAIDSDITTTRTPGEWSPIGTNSAGEMGRLLRLACSSGNEGGVCELITSGADVEELDQEGLSALHLAAANGYDKIVRLLVKYYGANKEANDRSANTPLLNAARSGYVEIVRALVELGADVEATNNGGQTPLIVAAAAGEHEAARVLLERGANIEHADSTGSTAFHHAIRNEHSDTVRILHGKGASPWAINNNNETPFHLAIQLPHDRISNQLLISVLRDERPSTAASRVV